MDHSNRQKMIIAAIEEIEKFSEVFNQTYTANNTGTRLARIWISEALLDKQEELWQEVDLMFEVDND